MDRKKPMTFIRPLKNRLMWLASLLLIVGLAAINLNPIFQSHADKADAPGQTKEEKQEKDKKKPLANVTIDREGYFIKNAGTPHAFIALKKKLIGERAPDLSASTIEGEVLEGATVRYTITLKNKGNINATDIDVLNELDSRFGEPKHFVFKECGKRYKKSSEGNQVELSNILVKKDKNCLIEYDVTATANGTMGNWLYLSPAAEGGEEIGPIEAASLKIRVTPEQEDELPEESVSEDAEEIQDTPSQEEGLSEDDNELTDESVADGESAEEISEKLTEGELPSDLGQLSSDLPEGSS